MGTSWLTSNKTGNVIVFGGKTLSASAILFISSSPQAVCKLFARPKFCPGRCRPHGTH